MADLLRDMLIDGGAADVDILAGGFADQETREKIGGLGVMTIAAMAMLFVEAGKHEHVLLVFGERFECEWQLVIRSGLGREPILFPNAVWKINARHADWRLHVGSGRRARDRLGRGFREHFAHRLQDRQAQH